MRYKTVDIVKFVNLDKMKRLIDKILVAIFGQKVSKTDLREMLEQNDCVIKPKYSFTKLGKSVDEISAFEALELEKLSNCTTVISTEQQANEYINRKREIEGIVPIGLYSMRHKVNEELVFRGQYFKLN